MSTENKEIILEADDAAASKKSVEGWVSRTGQFYGDNESLARWDGATHRLCDKHGIYSIRAYCEACRINKQIERYKNLESKIWDGKASLYSEAEDKWFFIADDFWDFIKENPVANIYELRLVFIEPKFASPIDPAEHYSDDLPDGISVPNEIEEAFRILNETIKDCGQPLCYYPTDIAAKIELL